MSRLYMLDESEDIAKVGSLGAHLTMLSKAGLRVVSGFIIPSGFALIDGMSNEILRSFDRLESRSVVLRASLPSHDLDGEVIRDVKRDVLLDTVTYVQKNAARHGRNAAIIIQKNLAAETAGTIHSINPVTKDAKEVLIEANLWMGDTVLGGENTPDMILVDKNTGALALESEEESEICLTPEQVQQLHRVVCKVEKITHGPVSVDWAYDNGILYILRARPLNQKRFEEYQIWPKLYTQLGWYPRKTAKFY